MEKFKIPAIAFAITLFTALISIIATNILYQPKAVIKRGFQVEVATDGKPVAKKEEAPVDIETLLKTADAEKGVKISKKCTSCHSLGKGEATKVGPNLFGVVGRKRASTGFSYSDAMTKKGGSWSVADLNQFITKPKDFVPGTKMAFPGLKKPQDRANLILFLQKNK